MRSTRRSTTRIASACSIRLRHLDKTKRGPQPLAALVKSEIALDADHQGGKQQGRIDRLSPRRQRLRDLGGVAGVGADFLADDALGDLQIGAQLGPELAEFGPKHHVQEALG